jgi:DNA-binding XRE family transcriptional regulator
VYLDVSIHAQLFQRALARSMTADDLATELLREDLKVRPMSIEGNRAKGFSRAPKRIEVSVGESVRIIREMQGLSQNQLAAAAGIPQATISSIERGRVNLGVERAKALARALHVHPAVLVFPGWEVQVAPAA